MKLVCAQNDLSTNLSLVSRAVPSRPSHPVLANVLLSADMENQQVKLVGFDLSLGVQTSFPAQVESSGIITLPAKLLNDIVSRLPGGNILLQEVADTAVTLTSASGQYQVRGMGAEEFPELPQLEDGEAAYLPVEALIDGLRGTLFATSADETKQVLTGVHLTLDQDNLEFAATDGHRLAVVQVVLENDAEAPGALSPADDTQLSVTVPAKALRELERLVQVHGTSEAIALRFDLGQVIFELGHQRLTSRLLEGQYPNYRQLLPRQFGRQMTLERRVFLSALERIAVLADQKNNIVKLSLDHAQQQVTISVDALEVGSGLEVVPAQISGEDLDIAFNVKYLMDGIKALNTSEIQMQFNSATSPVVLTPLGELKMTYLVMPVQIRS